MNYSYKKCVVPNCNSKYKENPEIGYFKFPRTESVCRQWIDAIKNVRLQTLSIEKIKNKYAVCANHFESKDFQTNEKKKLNRGAIPTCNINNEYDVTTFINVATSTTSSSPNYPETNQDIQRNIIQSVHSHENLDTLPVQEPTRNIAAANNNSSIKASRRGKQILTPRKMLLSKELKTAKKRLSVLKWRYSKIRKNLFNPKKVTADQISELINDSHFQGLDNLSAIGQKFITSQLQQAKKKKMGRKWSLQEKLLYLPLYKKSSRAYALLQTIFILPSPKTLQRLLQRIPIEVGIHKHILASLSKITFEKQPLRKYCTLVFDEVAFQPHLDVLVKSDSIEVKGLEEFEDGKSKHICDKALVFMLRGLNQQWKQPIAVYFAKSYTKTFQLAKLIETVIATVHSMTDFKILATVSDQGSCNVAAIKHLAKKSGLLENNCRYKINDSIMFHIFDAPHLLKCMRNNFLSKDIHFNGKIAKWSDIISLYDRDALTPDGKVCPKLTDFHIKPEGSQKMKVSFAAQIFSNTVYSALSLLLSFNCLDCSGTAEFIHFMDMLFDSVNSRCRTYKPMNRPLSASTEKYIFEFWAEATEKLLNLKFVKDGQQVAVPPSVKNFIVTIKNIQCLWHEMKKLGFKYLSTRTLNQDPLENMFGAIRGLCGQNNRLTSVQFMGAYRSCTVNNLLKTPTGANCENDETRYLVDLIDNVDSSTYSHFHSAIHHNPSGCSKAPTSKMSLQMHRNTSAYIAGYICRKVAKQKCVNCILSLTTSSKSNSHLFITSKDYGTRLQYPSETLTTYIDESRSKIFRMIPQFINNNLLNIPIEAPHFIDCDEHKITISAEIRKAIIITMCKYFVNIVNKKLTKKDLRGNSVVDQYLSIYGFKYRLTKS